MTPQPRRKKWTEAEERGGRETLWGLWSKMKTREKKYKPIALHVNSMHHVRDPVLYPWQWTWKDVSTKVQNMRHQYKEVFGDVPLVFTSNDGVGGGNECNGGFEGGGHEMDIMQFEQLGQVPEGDFVGGIDGVENGVMDLEFDYDGEEGEENYNGGTKTEVSLREDAGARFICEDTEPNAADMRKKRKVLKGLEKKAWGFLVNQLGHLREMESRFEQREVERERERQRREHPN
ncbi:UNVERIFIED_CONTAM: hypothetical protein Sradi_2479700 [Sesamum radiatum]|uniref:Uncharacterized protein n=1 Tax=Sesamum radiatum TaxID=300843 RepID=A0AAW2SKE9_SESRA